MGRSWIFKADVRGHYLPEDSLVIDGFELKSVVDEEKGTIWIATLKIEAKDLDDAIRQAKLRYEEIFDALTLSTGGAFEYELAGANEITSGSQVEKLHGAAFLHTRLPFAETRGSDQIERVCEETQEILGLLPEADQYAKKAVEYFIIGTKLPRWIREAFLNFFKTIELVSDRFLSDLEAELKRKIPDLERNEIKKLATRKRMILNACRILGIENVDENVKRLVKVRNSFDVAHATVGVAFRDEDLRPCRELARELILRYMRKYSSS